MESVWEAFDIFFDAEWCLDAVEEFAECISRLVGERFFSTAEHELYFHFVSVCEKFFRLRPLEVEIMRVGAKAKTDAFGLDLLLFALRFLFFLAFGVEIFAVVENFADGWRCFWGHFDEVEFLLFGASDGLFDRHVFGDGTVRVDDKHKWHANVFVDARLGKLDDFRLWSSVTTSAHAYAAFSFRLPAFSCWQKNYSLAESREPTAESCFRVELMGIAPMSSDEFRK